MSLLHKRHIKMLFAVQFTAWLFTSNFYSLKLRVAVASHNFKWVKTIVVEEPSPRLVWQRTAVITVAYLMCLFCFYGYDVSVIINCVVLEHQQHFDYVFYLLQSIQSLAKVFILKGLQGFVQHRNCTTVLRCTHQVANHFPLVTWLIMWYTHSIWLVASWWDLSIKLHSIMSC